MKSFLEAASVPAFIITGPIVPELKNLPPNFEHRDTVVYSEHVVTASFARPQTKVRNPCFIEYEWSRPLKAARDTVEAVAIARWHRGLSTVLLGTLGRYRASDAKFKSVLPHDALFPHERWSEFPDWCNRMMSELLDPARVEAWESEKDARSTAESAFRVETDTPCVRCGGTDIDILTARPARYAVLCMRCNQGRELYEQRSLPNLFDSVDEAEDGWAEFNRETGGK